MNNKPSILAVCNTPFQIIVACHILQTYYQNAEVDLYISSGIKGAKQLVQNARETGKFRKVELIVIRKTFYKDKSVKDKLVYVCKRAWEIIATLRLAKTIYRQHYDVVLFSNISILTKRLTTLFLHSNPSCRIELFEEGTITYTQQFADGDSEKTPYRRFVDSRGVINCLDTLYVFNPEFLVWKPSKGKVVTLPKLTHPTEDFHKTINTIFGYEQCEDKYDKPLIFFEESHVMEGFEVPDVEIVNRIAEKIGKSNVMVKIHPRNYQNRFAQLGYKTNKNIAIPWEVIMLNQSMAGKILVTISSGAAIYPYLYFGIPTKTYSLMNCLSERPGLMKGDNGELMQKIYTSYPDVFKAPSSMEEFLADI